MHIVIRRWTNAAALAETMLQQEHQVKELLRGVPGFVAYYATREGDGVTTVTVCHDREGTQESTRRAGEFVRQHLAGATIAAPEVTEGETFFEL
jgi:hypothetical protein